MATRRPPREERGPLNDPDLDPADLDPAGLSTRKDAWIGPWRTPRDVRLRLECDGDRSAQGSYGPHERRRVPILGALIDKAGVSSTRQRIEEFVASGTPHQIVTVNLDFLRISLQDPRFRKLINQADLAVPDGMPLLWAARLCGDPFVERVTGPDLMEMGAALSAKMGCSLFLLGAAPGVAEMAAVVLTRRYPGTRVAGIYAPPVGPFSPGENDRMVSLIRRCHPEILFVAFGCPKQDFWIQQHVQELSVPVAIGVGGTFNYIAGIIPRAPVWAQRAGLEWLFRLKREPRRLWCRYLIDDVPVLLRLALDSSWRGANKGAVVKPAGR